ncbi:unnamed protein product [Rotaria magnacalcarata]|uniref:Uncharacterized protein n=1 Tax=Rotaria magnacalcarata TaxID=392030 RepID=A0A819WGC7_9BILA|nr:unnamed protein product [Rotaria magnacalcarata]
MLNTLHRSTKGIMLISNDGSDVEWQQLSNKTIFLFPTTQFFASTDTSFEQNFFVFILESDVNKVDQRLRFAADEDLICQLADELYRHYTKEAQKYFHLGNVKMSNGQECLANRIYSELRNVHNNIITLENNNPSFVCPKTVLIWLKSKMQDYDNANQLQKYFNEIVSSYSSFYNQDDRQHYLRNDENIGGIFLIIDVDYNESIVATFEHLSNVKCLYRYGQSKSETKGIIRNPDDLRYQLAHDLIAHYGDFGAVGSEPLDSSTLLIEWGSV